MTRYKMITDRYLPKWRSDVGMNRLTAAIDAPLAAIDRLETKYKALVDDQRLSPLGRAEELRNFAKNDTVGVMRRSQNIVKSMRADLQGSRNKLRVPKPDKSDVAGAILRMDMRTWLKDMNRGELMGALLDKDTPIELLQAAYEVPPQMIGSDAAIMEDIQKRLLELHHGPVLEQIEEMDEALTVVNGVVEVALMDVATFTLFEARQKHEFTAWYEHNSAAIDQEFAADEARKKVSDENIAKSFAMLTPRAPNKDEERSIALISGEYYIENGKILYNDPALNIAA